MNRRTQHLFIAVFLLILFLLLLNLGMEKPLDHDEHQFVASAALYARDGLLPYRDYPYFHQPYLVFIYGTIFQFSDRLLFSARLFSILCAFATLTLVFGLFYRRFGREAFPKRFLLAAGGVIMLIGSPLFAHTAGLAWNHDLPMLLTLGAFLLYTRAIRRQGGILTPLLAGLLLGVATGVRLSFAPLFAPFALLSFFYRQTLPRNVVWQLPTLFAAGFSLALLPSLLFLVQYPTAYLFGNLQYPVLNTLYREGLGYTRSMDFFSKILYTLEVLVQPGNLLIVAAALFFAFRKAWIGDSRRDHRRPEVFFVLLLLPFLLIGTFAPTPSFKQYFYPPLFFCLLAAAYGLAEFPRESPHPQRHLTIWGLLLILFSLYNLPQFPDSFRLSKAKYWQPNQIHRLGKSVGNTLAAEGPVLTFAPIIPLEGGLAIYPQLVTGPFAWRTSSYLSGEERKTYRMLAESDLSEFLREHPPAAILQGFEWREEPALIEYAREMGYQEKSLLMGKRLWIAPEESN